MTLIEQYKNGDITLDELRKEAKDNPALAKEIEALLAGEELSEEDLENVSGGGRPGSGGDYGTFW